VLVNEYVLRKEFVADGDAVFTYALLARDYNIIRALADHKGIDSRKPSYLIIALKGRLQKYCSSYAAGRARRMSPPQLSSQKS